MNIRSISIGALVVILCLVGCSSAPIQTMKPEIFYQRKLPFNINGKWFDGVAVVDEADTYNVFIKPPTKPEMLVIAGKGRYHTFRSDQIESEGLKYEYKPTELEGEGASPIRIHALGKDGRNYYGFIAFRARQAKARAAVTCDGEVKVVVGTGICQLKENLFGRLDFENEVKITETKESCKALPQSSETRFDFKMPHGECSYAIADLKNKEFFKFYTLGFEEVPVVEVK